jgi:hypothetical protein
MCVLSLVLVRYDVGLPHVCLSYGTTCHSLSCAGVCASVTVLERATHAWAKL